MIMMGGLQQGDRGAGAQGPGGMIMMGGHQLTTRPVLVRGMSLRSQQWCVWRMGEQ